jgi:hypothetical protein
VELDALNRRFPWGLVVVEDEGSSSPIPSWATKETVVTAGADALVVRVRHEQEGPVLVHICRDEADLEGDPVFAGLIRVASGTISVGDALRTDRVRTAVPVGPTFVRVLVEPTTGADHVDVVIVS